MTHFSQTECLHKYCFMIPKSRHKKDAFCLDLSLRSLALREDSHQIRSSQADVELESCGETEAPTNSQQQPFLGSLQVTATS